MTTYAYSPDGPPQGTPEFVGTESGVKNYIFNTTGDLIATSFGSMNPGQLKQIDVYTTSRTIIGDTTGTIASDVSAWAGQVWAQTITYNDPVFNDSDKRGYKEQINSTFNSFALRFAFGGDGTGQTVVVLDASAREANEDPAPTIAKYPLLAGYIGTYVPDTGNEITDVSNAADHVLQILLNFTQAIDAEWDGRIESFFAIDNATTHDECRAIVNAYNESIPDDGTGAVSYTHLTLPTKA